MWWLQVDGRAQQLAIGDGTRAPKWAVAYKFAAEEAETELLDITVQVRACMTRGQGARGHCVVDRLPDASHVCGPAPFFLCPLTVRATR